MSGRRRPPPPKVYSISCTDAEWERVRRLADAQGMSISRYLVERGLTVELQEEPEAPPRLVLDEREQRELYERVARIAERTVSAESEKAVLTRIRYNLALLAELAMRDMVREGREDELRVLLVELVGEDSAGATIEWIRARMKNGPRGS